MTLSHHLSEEMPCTTVSLEDDPHAHNTIVIVRWDTADADDLKKCHDRLVTCLQMQGFTALQNVALLLDSQESPKKAAGKSRLVQLLTPEIAAHVSGVE